VIIIYIIIAGGGVLGRTLTRQLISNHDVVVIDQQQEVCERIYSEYGAVSVCGNATQIHVLRDAGIEKCDVAIGVMDQDTDNLAFTILSQNFGVDKILVRMRNPEYKNAYQLAGTSYIGEEMDILVDNFITEIEEPNIRKVVSIGRGKAEVSILVVPENSVCSGLTVSEIANSEGFPDDCVIAGIYDQNKDELVIPKGNTKIQEFNQIFLVATRSNMEKASKFFMKENKRR
jgi:trk system potassium uptake protein TrkA